MTQKMRRFGLLAGGAIVLLLAYAWFDGGETALRPISEPVALPDGVR